MTWILVWLHVVALATWLGQTVFFGAVVAPALFRNLEREQAGTITALIFPGYYATGYICGALLLGTAVLLWRRTRPGGRAWSLAAIVAALMIADTLFAGLYLLPQADALRPLLHDPATVADAEPRFAALHRLAVQLNVAVLAGNLILTAIVATRVSAGIVPPRRLSRYGERIQ